MRILLRGIKNLKMPQNPPRQVHAMLGSIVFKTFVYSLDYIFIFSNLNARKYDIENRTRPSPKLVPFSIAKDVRLLSELCDGMRIRETCAKPPYMIPNTVHRIKPSLPK